MIRLTAVMDAEPARFGAFSYTMAWNSFIGESSPKGGAPLIISYKIAPAAKVGGVHRAAVERVRRQIAQQHAGFENGSNGHT